MESGEFMGRAAFAAIAFVSLSWPASPAGAAIPDDDLDVLFQTFPVILSVAVALLGALLSFLAASKQVEQSRSATAEQLKQNQTATEAQLAQSREAVATQLKQSEDRISHEREQGLLTRAHSGKIEDKKRALEKQRLMQDTNCSEREAEQIAYKNVLDRNVAEATLLQAYFDKLTSDDDRELELALSMLSAFVDEEVMNHLTANVRLTSRAVLSRLAANGTSPLSRKAQEVLNEGWEKALDSIVVLQVGSRRAFGFAVKERWIVAPAIGGAGDAVKIRAFKSTPKAEEKSKPLCAAVDPILNLMIVKAKGIKFRHPLRLRVSALPRPGEPVTAILPKTKSTGEFVVRAGLLERQTEGPDGVLRGKISAEECVEGAPLFDIDGMVVGMVTKSADPRGHGPSFGRTSFAVSSGAILSLLSKGEASIKELSKKA